MDSFRVFVIIALLVMALMHAIHIRDIILNSEGIEKIKSIPYIESMLEYEENEK